MYDVPVEFHQQTADDRCKKEPNQKGNDDFQHELFF